MITFLIIFLSSLEVVCTIPLNTHQNNDTIQADDVQTFLKQGVIQYTESPVIH